MLTCTNFRHAQHTCMLLNVHLHLHLQLHQHLLQLPLLHQLHLLAENFASLAILCAWQCSSGVSGALVFLALCGIALCNLLLHLIHLGLSLF